MIWAVIGFLCFAVVWLFFAWGLSMDRCRTLSARLAAMEEKLALAEERIAFLCETTQRRS